MKIKDIIKGFNDYLGLVYTNDKVDYHNEKKLRDEVMACVSHLQKKYDFEIINGTCYRTKSMSSKSGGSALQFEIVIDSKRDRRLRYPRFKATINKVTLEIHEELLKYLDFTREQILEMTLDELEYHQEKHAIVSSCLWIDEEIKRYEDKIKKYKEQKMELKDRFRELGDEYVQEGR